MEWTKKHQQEALRRTYEIAAEMARSGSDVSRDGLAALAYGVEASEARWRDGLRRYFGLDAARVDREVALVHALATAAPEVRAMVDAARADHERMVAKLTTGKWVRETGIWRAGANEFRGVTAKARAREWAGRSFSCYRVSRIRRAA